jgi:hypothetical protein
MASSHVSCAAFSFGAEYREHWSPGVPAIGAGAAAGAPPGMPKQGAPAGQLPGCDRMQSWHAAERSPPVGQGDACAGATVNIETGAKAMAAAAAAINIFMIDLFVRQEIRD